MIRIFLIVAASASLASGCATPATSAPSQARFLAGRLLGDMDSITGSAASLDRPIAYRRRPSLGGLPRHAHPGAALVRVDAANRAAVHEPATDDYLGAVQVYPWSEGALYRLYAAPGRVSDIALQAGESLISVAAGDTLRWIIGDTTSGSGPGRQTHILIKPSAEGLSTNVVIMTDRRTYHINAESNAHTAMASIAWTYPQDSLLAVRGTSSPTTDPVAADLPVEQLNFDYRIEGDHPAWRPVRAFDDGQQVFIQFPPTLSVAPPLFVTGDNGRAELVNYRIRGSYYVVDRLFTAAELRMGEKRQQVVRIVRRAAEARSRGRGE